MKNELQNELLNYFRPSRFNWFITLTYKNHIDNIQKVNNDIYTIAKYLREKAYGKHAVKFHQSKQSLMMVGAIELHANGSIHIHLMLKRPPKDIPKSKKYSKLIDKTDEMLLEYWEKRKKHSYQNHPEQLLSQSDSDSRLGYCLKYTSSNNTNYFICHWDSSDPVLAAECNR